MVLAIGHTLRAHKALGCPDALSGFLEVAITSSRTASSSAITEVYGQAASSDHPIFSSSLTSTLIGHC
jgi:hypothetical protein